ncbi:hypothetical protein ACFLTR_04185 [Chloroflexota bacterium]
MTIEKLPSSNILPHNPLNAAGLLDEVKRLKGDKTWLQVDCECILAKHPGSQVVKQALAQITGTANVKKIEKVREKQVGKLTT